MFFLSFILGGVSRNPIGTIVLRALISFLVFGGLLYLALLILRRYVPEVVPVSGKEFTGIRDTPGQHVDLTVSDDRGQAVPPVPGYIDEETTPPETETYETDDALTGEPGGDEYPEEEDRLPDINEILAEQEREYVPGVAVKRSATSEKQRTPPGFIKVHDTQIPNDPEIMARAIKQVMKQDE